MPRKSFQKTLFLYEGDTENEFFPVLWDLKLKGLRPDRSINLNGTYNLNGKVANVIYNYLENFKDVRELYVVVEHDREGKRNEMESELNIDLIIRQINDKRLKGIHDLIITQTIESLFFIDIDNIYTFLKAPKGMRNLTKFRNHENFNHVDLSKLFRDISKARNGFKEYKKGKRTENFINHLDLEKIYNGCMELQDAVNFIKGIK